MSTYTTFKQLGIQVYEHTHNEYGTLPKNLTKGDAYCSKRFDVPSRSLYEVFCVESTTNSLTFEEDGQLITIPRRECKGLIPRYRRLDQDSILKQLRKIDLQAKLSIPKTGCQLHGEIDAEVILNGEKYLIPWNY